MYIPGFHVSVFLRVLGPSFIVDPSVSYFKLRSVQLSSDSPTVVVFVVRSLFLLSKVCRILHNVVTGPIFLFYR